MIEDLGGRIATLWSEIRPATRGLVERELKTTTIKSHAPNAPYDPWADSELSRLLTALDDCEAEPDSTIGADEIDRLRHVANACASVLEQKTRSAEVFVQLIRRAEIRRDYKRIDTLADALTARFAPSVVCELARTPDLVARTLAKEALAQAPTSLLVGLLRDPVDSEVARDALRRQAIEYGAEEARLIVNALDQAEMVGEDL